jgi:DNA-binding transcriptional ArsR family regulator
MDSDLDLVFKALADPTRRQILDRLRDRGGQTLVELCERLAMTRQAVSKHVTILEAANLVHTRREGRQKRHYLNPVPINDIYARWIRKYERDRLDALATLKAALEDQDQ